MLEREIQERLKRNPELIEEGLKFKEEEIFLEGRYLDLYFIDIQNNPLIVELKKGNITDKAVGQLLFYKSAFHRINGIEPRVMLVGSSISTNIKLMLEENGIEYKTLNWIQEKKVNKEKQFSYPIIHGWDIGRIQGLASKMDDPVRVIDFKGIPCAIHGAPLKKSKNGGYEDLLKAIYSKKINLNLKDTKGRMIVVNHEGNQRVKGYKGNRFLVMHETIQGELDPVTEVTNRGRCILRCKQWAEVLECSFIENEDERVLKTEEYNQFLKILFHRQVV